MKRSIFIGIVFQYSASNKRVVLRHFNTTENQAVQQRKSWSRVTNAIKRFVLRFIREDKSSCRGTRARSSRPVLFADARVDETENRLGKDVLGISWKDATGNY